MDARVLLLFWERVCGCHTQRKHRLGEEAQGALMVLWVPGPSVLAEKGSRHAVWGHFTKRHSEVEFCLHADVPVLPLAREVDKPRTRGTDLEVGSPPRLSPSLQLAVGSD